MASPLRAFLRDPLKVGFIAVLLGIVIILEAMLLLRPRTTPVAASLPYAPVAVPAPAPAPAPAPRELPAAKTAPRAPPIALPPIPQAQPQSVAPVPESPKAAPAPRPEPEAAKPVPRRAEERPARPAPQRAAPPEPPAPEVRPAPTPPPEPPAERKPRAAPSLAAVPVTRAPVEFPVAAAAKNIESGTVKARLTIDAEGRVSTVQVLEARPRRFFDEEATRSLRQWRFNPGADNRSYEVEISFQR